MRSFAVSPFGRIGPLACALVIAGIAVGSARVTHASVPADALYGTAGDHLVTVDQNDASITALPAQPSPDSFYSAWLLTPPGDRSLPGALTLKPSPAGTTLNAC